MWVKTFSEISLQDIEQVGGKNASLGEMYQHLSEQGIRVPNGFAICSEAYWELLKQNQLETSMAELLSELDREHFSNLHAVGTQIRSLLLAAQMPEVVKTAILSAYQELQASEKGALQVAVRSSATAEDLPEASFAGQQESYLNIRNAQELLEACRNCYASLFTDRAIKYREDHGFEHMKVALSIGVQKMVRSDLASAGVCFTLDPETGFDQVTLITGSWGLGENVVQGSVNPDEFYVFKPALAQNKYPLLAQKLGDKALTMVYADAERATQQRRSIGVSHTIVNIETPLAQREQFVLSPEEVIALGQWCQKIEAHYQKPMDIEWAKDGISGEMFIVQARPETVHSSQRQAYRYRNYRLKEKSQVLVSGKNIGDRIAAGRARILKSPAEIDKIQPGDVLVTEITNPDWDPILKKAAAIVTNKGGRTSHAAIVARETGAVAVVGTGDATERIRDGQEVTVSCIDGSVGQVYEGRLEWEEELIDTAALKTPEKTDVMLILADPEQAFKLSFLPCQGVGLMRLEFVINNSIQIHPMALVNYPNIPDTEVKAKIETLTHQYADKKAYFVEKLSEAVATIAAAFYPRDVIVRMSDFKSNEYANLIGGQSYEPHEENPMIGFRGASRYSHSRYREGFALECQAMKRVRDEMGLTNVKLMIPFCRTLDEGKRVLLAMEEFGLKQGNNGLEIYVMCEIPSNVILAEDYAEIFDGFSIGSNDLTQLTLGVDRDSSLMMDSFDEQNPAVTRMIAMAIRSAIAKGRKIGLCGQAPSDHPEFAQFLVEQGINSISFNPDALLKGIENIVRAEALHYKDNA